MDKITGDGRAVIDLLDGKTDGEEKPSCWLASV